MVKHTNGCGHEVRHNRYPAARGRTVSRWSRQQQGRSQRRAVGRPGGPRSCAFDASPADSGDLGHRPEQPGLSTTTTHRLLVAMRNNRLCARPATGATASAPCWSSWPAARVPAGTPPSPVMTALRGARSTRPSGCTSCCPAGERVVVDQVEPPGAAPHVHRHRGADPPAARGPGEGHPVDTPRGAAGVLAVPSDRVGHAAHDHRPRRAARGLAMARSRGWAGSRSERTPGIRAVAAPIFDHSGAAIGALGLSVPEVRMDDAAPRSSATGSFERVGDLRGAGRLPCSSGGHGRGRGAGADPAADLPAAGSPPAGPPRPAGGSAGRLGQPATRSGVVSMPMHLDRDRDVVTALQ